MKRSAGPHVDSWMRRGSFEQHWLALGVCSWALGIGSFAHAQASPSGPEPEDILPQSDFEDPIGIDGQSHSLTDIVRAEDEAARAHARAQAADRARYGPRAPTPGVERGEVVWSLRSTRELAHRTAVTLRAGLAEVAVELEVGTPIAKPAEVRYRLAVPEGARLASLQVCNERGCREGVVERPRAWIGAYDDAVGARGADAPLPVAHAVETRDRRGHAIALRVAPVAKGHDVRVRLGYLAEAPVRGGVVRLRLPARGMDPRAAPTEVVLQAPGMREPRIGAKPAGEVAARFDPWADVELSARIPEGQPPNGSVTRVACEGAKNTRGRCARAHVAAGPRPPQTRDLVVALDVSPSTEGPVRGRMLAAATALLGAAPDDSRVRVVAFAGRAVPALADPAPAGSIGLEPFARAIDRRDLGSATRLEAVWPLVEPWLGRGSGARRPLLVIVGDGGLTLGEARPFERARRAKVEVAVLNLSARPTAEALRRGAERTGGIVVEAAAAAEQAARGQDLAALDEQVAAFFAPVVARRVSVTGAGSDGRLGNLRAGEQLSWRGRARGKVSLRAAGRTWPAKAAPEALAVGLGAEAADAEPTAMVAVDARDLRLDPGAPRPPRGEGTACDPRGPARRHGGVSSDAAPLALAAPHACSRPLRRKPSKTRIGKGMPAEPLLAMLRLRIIPMARGCFRRDRAGRADYEVRAVFAFRLADREIAAARIEGKVPEPLRACLLNAVDGLEVPRFAGVVAVRYPLRTVREPLPREIELTPRTAEQLDTAFGGVP